jgi:hypothetical protein
MHPGALAAALREVDAQLLGLSWWRTHQLDAALLVPSGQREACRARVLAKYRRDLDVLLDLRSWLCDADPGSTVSRAARREPARAHDLQTG